ncbi:hypothetical protein J5N97_028357 [Dioscorea zingiberensis]|uniref:Uncharacterized protein n=1 Tax=Dioscorea zingiberensis TaxID=325984 RepID=A0A9D5BZ22_9LILI|nr:hypothetical protein J5N97_028357 [Dioscorea zingiberensis]
MADIALLVIEEFERRKRSEIGHGEEKQSSVLLSLLWKTMEVEKKVEFAVKALEPKSTLGRRSLISHNI